MLESVLGHRSLFFEGLRSERQLMQGVAARLRLRWYLSDHLIDLHVHRRMRRLPSRHPHRPGGQRHTSQGQTGGRPARGGTGGPARGLCSGGDRSRPLCPCAVAARAEPSPGHRHPHREESRIRHLRRGGTYCASRARPPHRGPLGASIGGPVREPFSCRPCRRATTR